MFCMQTGSLESYTYFSHGVNSTFLALLSWKNGFEVLGVPKVTRKLNVLKRESDCF